MAITFRLSRGWNILENNTIIHQRPIGNVDKVNLTEYIEYYDSIPSGSEVNYTCASGSVWYIEPSKDIKVLLTDINGSGSIMESDFPIILGKNITSITIQNLTSETNKVRVLVFE